MKTNANMSMNADIKINTDRNINSDITREIRIGSYVCTCF